MLPETLNLKAALLSVTLFFMSMNFIHAETNSFFNETEPSLHVNFDACTSFFGGSNIDFSEFTATSIENPDCSQLRLVGNSVYRSDPANNGHSCAPGFEETAMCVDGLDNCFYVPGDNKSLKFDVEVIPGLNGFASLKEISFYEQAPVSFNFVEGSSGTNDYPTLLGIRVLVDNVEIFRQENLPTTRTWMKRTIDFSVVSGFTVSDTTVFNIELLPYCLIGNGAPVRAWDIDELTIIGGCSDVNGGLIVGAESNTVCSTDTSSSVRTFTVSLESGANFSWILTSLDGVIVDLSDIGNFDFSDYDNGIYNVYHLAYESGLNGLTVGMNISEIEGCFDFSNAAAINNSKVEGGTLSFDGGDNVLICATDSVSNLIETDISGVVGNVITYIISDNSGNIISVQDNNILDFVNVAEGSYNVTAYVHNGDLFNALVSMNIMDLGGCFATSNDLTVVKSMVEGGTISFEGSDMLTACASSSFLVSPELENAFGENMAWVISSPNGFIVAVSDTLPIDISIMNFTSVEVRHVSFLSGTTGITVGSRISNIDGCFDFSNTIEVMLPSVDGGQIAIDGQTEFAICTNQSGNNFTIDVSDALGDASTLIITDTSGVIIDLLNTNEVDFDDADPGICVIWNVSYVGAISGLEIGSNVSDLEGCYDISNSITVDRIEIEAGLLENNLNLNEINICSGDGQSDAIVFSVSGTQGAFETFVITDEQGLILEVATSDTIDFEGAVGGTCLVYNVVYLDSETELVAGLNVDSLAGCYDLSNEITIIREEVNGGAIELTTGGVAIDVIVGDGMDDNVEVSLTDNVGDSSVWIITDTLGVIIDLPQATPFNFENAGEGVCLIWNAAFNSTISNLEVGNNVSDLMGCFALSNSITVTRTNLDGGVLTLLNGEVEISICVGDPIIDSIDVVLVDNEGPNSAWIITDTFGLILELPIAPPFTFENAPSGVCQIWQVSFANMLTGLTVGENVSNVGGAFNLSNPINVIREKVDGGQISGPAGIVALEVCSGDGIADELFVMVNDNVGQNNQWVIVDENNTILELPITPPFDFEDAPTGICLVYNLAYEDGLLGLEVDSSLNTLVGCYDLSNAITVTRNFVDGGIIATAQGLDTISIVVGDAIIDSIDLSLIDAVGDSTDWVITDSDGVILEIKDGPPFVFENAEAGTCLIYHMSSNDVLTNFAVGDTLNQATGCYDLSNAIVVERTAVNGGIIVTTGDTTAIDLCIINQEETLVEVDLSDSVGDTVAWIITDAMGVILELPSGPPFDFAEAPTGLCQIWHIAYIGTLTGLEIGENVSGLAGTYDLSNSIDVNRDAVYGGELMTTDSLVMLTIIANDGISDAFDVILDNEVGDSFNWVITDTLGVILALPGMPPFDLDSAGAGVCQLWNLSYNDTIIGLAVDSNIVNLIGCFDFSNPITVIREAIDGGDIETLDGLTEVTVCLSDMLSDSIDVVLTDTSGMNSAWIITDTFGLILELPLEPPFDFSNAGVGVCQIWHLSYDATIEGLEVDSTLNSLMGSFDLSNPISVTRDSLVGGSLTFENGMLVDTIVVGDGIVDSIDVALVDNLGDNSVWVITDTFGIILELPLSPPFTFEDAGGGVCQIWNLSYSDGLLGLSVGENVNDLSGCFEFSNALTIVRQGLMGGNLMTADSLTMLSICVGDGISDAFDVILSDTLGPVYSWVVTDTTGVILDLPIMPPFDFEGAGLGVCQLWNITHEASLTGLEVGANVDTLMGNHDFSNPILINRSTSTGGSLMTVDSLLAITIDVGEGVTDTVDVILADTIGQNFAWVITDTFGMILDLPLAPPFFFEDFAGGVCQIWNISFADGLVGLSIGENVSDLMGCFDFSNAIEVTKIETIIEGGNLTTDDLLTEVDICVGDGMTNPIFVSLTDNEGPNEQWVITDTTGLILGLPSGPPFDLELAGAGVCQIRNLAYANGLVGLVIGEDVDTLGGLYDFSNAIIVNRTAVDGGEIETDAGETEITITVGDGVTDSIQVVLTGFEGDTSVWVITDTLGNIMELPLGPPFTFENAGGGVCQIWNLSYIMPTTGIEVGNNVSMISGCFELSNPITVNREGLNGGTLTDIDGNTTAQICLSTGIMDSLEVILIDTSGTDYQWVITDDAGEILELPNEAPFDFSTYSSGTSFLYNMAYDTLPENLVVGDTITNLIGLFDFSNAIVVNRDVVEGGNLTLEDGSLIDTIDVDDLVLDSVFVTLTAAIGDQMQWVITDTLGNILDLPLGEPFTFENAGGGTCYIRNLSYLLGLQGLAVGNNIDALDGCFELSNPVTIFREGLNSGIISFEDGSVFLETCQGDDIDDFIDINVIGAQGNQSKFITTKNGQIFVVGSQVFPFNFENINSGPTLDSFYIYNIAYDTLPGEFETGSFVGDLTGDFELSNSVLLRRNIVEGGSIQDESGEINSTLIVGDGIPDTLTLMLSGAFGDSLLWIVTNDMDTIVSFANSSEFIYADDAAQGTQKIYHASIQSNMIVGLEVGSSINDIAGCFGLSNSYTFTRKQINGGTLTTTDLETAVELCIGDGGTDFVNVVRTDQLGSVFNLVVTNSNGIIDFIPASSSIEFTSIGSYLIYNISHDGSLTGLVEGEDIEDLGGCFQLSNAVSVEADQIFSSMLSFDGGGDEISVCVGDGTSNETTINTSFATDSFVYAITDTFNIIDTILTATNSMGTSTFDFEDSDEGVCRIHSISYLGNFLAEQGDTIGVSTLSDFCATTSMNFLTVIKEDCSSSSRFDYSLFPNPVIDVLRLELRKRPYDESQVYIYNGDGKMLKNQKVDIKTNTVDISSLSPGIYYLKLMSKGLSEMSKFIIIE